MNQPLALKWIKLNLCLLLVLNAMQSRAVTTDQFSVHGLAAFNEEQANMLQSWLSQGVNATRATLGIYPTPLRLHVYPRKSNQPVPWAYTRRDKKGSVHFHVDTRFGLTKFVDDWTIYHELAHMALPYLGSEYRWLSEGFASYMQYQIMAQAGILKGTLEERYSSKINPHLRWFNSDLTAASIARRLMDNKQYPAAYWGSAYFFVLADSKLQQQHNIGLTQLISLYQDCCRANDNNLEEVLTSLDGMIEGKLFNQLIKEFENRPARKLYPEVLNQ
ncbi:hypothetical protein [uncultured Paraglaciecola sp.]|uniref:hypothetical protein n=1 Tax=uncultured Paraglaciecola sp. TaxID=1765024 RepID=UPI0030D7500B|tara:strand:+ start:193141 stop:193965 length:825 start_codon:yes stop_codon:yes gene_type:complete